MTTSLLPSSFPLSADDAADMLAALGSRPRLLVYRTLLRAGQAGITVTGLQRSTLITASTLNLHLDALVSVGLVAQTRVGRELFCQAKYADIKRLSHFLLEQCCADQNSAQPLVGIEEPMHVP